MNATLNQFGGYGIRVRVFVDFWNFQSSLRREESRFNVDWRGLGRTLTTEAAAVVDPTAPVAYQGMNVHGSYDPGNPNRFLHNTVATFPGVQVSEVPRQRKREISTWSTAPTDMIRLAWIGNYESACWRRHRDFIPERGTSSIHCTFPEQGMELAVGEILTFRPSETG